MKEKAWFCATLSLCVLTFHLLGEEARTKFSGLEFQVAQLMTILRKDRDGTDGITIGKDRDYDTGIVSELTFFLNDRDRKSVV